MDIAREKLLKDERENGKFREDGKAKSKRPDLAVSPPFRPAAPHPASPCRRRRRESCAPLTPLPGFLPPPGADDDAERGALCGAEEAHGDPGPQARDPPR